MLAKSWLEWGVPISAPKLGCVVVLERKDPKMEECEPGWRGHVGFFLSKNANEISLLGGNQLDQVRVHAYPLSSVLAYRWPS